MMKNIWTEIKGILTAPLAERLDPVQLFLIVGLVLVFISAWLILLRYMQAGISTIAEEV
jgi:hypothetical protein